MRAEVKIGGAGGQGVITMAVMLAEAAGYFEDRYIAQTQSYGPEARGGASQSDVVLSDEPIDYIHTLDPDVLVAMSQPALDRYLGGVDPARALVFVDDMLVKRVPPPPAGPVHLYRVPATQLAVEQCKTAAVANTFMLTVVAVVSGVVNVESVRRVIEGQPDPNRRQANLDAVSAALEHCRSVGWTGPTRCLLKPAAG
jgi:2-oxoglutarate ferredoxin oxidoreductase subunit gamma